MHKHEAGVAFKDAINVDYTHVGRRASGIERITVEQFGGDALSPLSVSLFAARSHSRSAVLFAQMFQLPLHAIRNPRGIYLFPGFPPSPYFSFRDSRSVLFVHDLFLLTRRNELNSVGKYYMAPLFRLAIRRFKYFLTNSENTGRELKTYCRSDAQILPFRPRVRNVFGLTEGDRTSRPVRPRRLRVVSVGTIEPRKNFPKAAQICEALARRLDTVVELHIIGRFGWGQDISHLSERANVILHGYIDDAAAGLVISDSDFMLCTSHDEGLCLPLIEVQYCGIPVIAPDRSIFREVLDSSGIFMQHDEPDQIANSIADIVSAPFWRIKYALASKANIVRWNSIAEIDRGKVMSLLSILSARRMQEDL
jgi:glycosyltransferase involved in cell wall biosynthesis